MEALRVSIVEAYAQRDHWCSIKPCSELFSNLLQEMRQVAGMFTFAAILQAYRGLKRPSDIREDVEVEEAPEAEVVTEEEESEEFPSSSAEFEIEQAQNSQSEGGLSRSQKRRRRRR
jgi:hypothetical protein